VLAVSSGDASAGRHRPDCPEIDEFAGAELAALTGTTTRNGEQLIRDALLVRCRHPRLWSGIRSGHVDVWVAVKVARRCAAAELDLQEAANVDAQTTPYLATLPLRRFFDLVEAKIIEADPDAAEDRARAQGLARFVRTGRADEHGMKMLVARAHAGDITYLVAVLDRIAVILAERGDHTSVDERRVTALRILANPARALALLTGAALEHLDPSVETTVEAEQGLHSGGECSWMIDTEGRPLPGLPSHADLEPVDLADLDADVVLALAPTPVVAVGDVTPGSDPALVEEANDPALLHALMDSLSGFDARKLDPVTVFHVHVTDTTLTDRRGVVRVENLGPAVLGHVRDWLTHPMTPTEIQQQVRVRPVLDAEAVRPVDAYEWPATMSELATERTPYDVFPYGTQCSRSCEDDHIVPYRRSEGRKPAPGQTRLDNNAKLGKRHHRIKTFGGWALLHPEPGVYVWRTRHGHWLRVDPAGTHHLGRDPDLDAAWCTETEARHGEKAA
jgi:hypothetical protein